MCMGSYRAIALRILLFTLSFMIICEILHAYSSDSETVSSLLNRLDILPEVVDARAQVYKAYYEFKAVRAGLGPKLNLYYTYIYTIPEVSFAMPTPFGLQTFTINPKYNYDYGAEFTQLISTFGRLENVVQAKHVNLLSSVGSYINTRLEQSLDIYRGILGFYRARELVKLARSADDMAIEYLRVSKLLYERGIASRYELYRAQAFKLKADAGLTDAVRFQKLSLKALSEKVGVQIDSFDISSIESISNNELVKLDSNSVKPVDLDSYPIIYALGKQVQVLSYMKRSAEAESKPSLVFQLKYDWRKSTAFSPDSSTMALISLSVPIYDSGESSYKAEALRDARTSVEAKLERVRRSIQLARENAELNLRSAILKLKSALKEVEASEEAYRISKLRYENGLATNLELMDSQTAYNKAQVELVQARVEVIQAWIELLYYYGYDITDWNAVREALKGNCSQLRTVKVDDNYVSSLLSELILRDK